MGLKVDWHLLLLLSPAKINLGLWITGRQEDGYHTLESLFWPIDLCDFITLEENDLGEDGIAWDSCAPVCSPLPSKEENLVGKIRKLDPNALKNTSTWIEKSIPIGSGLGGGSSNVGTILRNLGKGALAPKLGADVSFFLNPRPSWVTGIGEHCDPVDTALAPYFLLVFPPHKCSTQEVFRAFDAVGSLSPSKPFPSLRTMAEFEKYLNTAHNQLESVVAARDPVTQEILSALRNTSALYAGLSGSGSTCVGVFWERETASAISKELDSFFRKNDCKCLVAATFAAKEDDRLRELHHGNHRSKSFSGQRRQAEGLRHGDLR